MIRKNYNRSHPKTRPVHLHEAITLSGGLDFIWSCCIDKRCPEFARSLRHWHRNRMSNKFPKYEVWFNIKFNLFFYCEWIPLRMLWCRLQRRENELNDNQSSKMAPVIVIYRVSLQMLYRIYRQLSLFWYPCFCWVTLLSWCLSQFWFHAFYIIYMYYALLSIVTFPRRYSMALHQRLTVPK